MGIINKLTQIEWSIFFSGEVIQIRDTQWHNGSLSNPAQHVPNKHVDPQRRADWFLAGWRWHNIWLQCFNGKASMFTWQSQLVHWVLYLFWWPDPVTHPQRSHSGWCSRVAPLGCYCSPNCETHSFRIYICGVKNLIMITELKNIKQNILGSFNTLWTRTCCSITVNIIEKVLFRCPTTTNTIDLWSLNYGRYDHIHRTIITNKQMQYEGI